MKGSGERFETPCHVSKARGLARERVSSDFDWSPDLRLLKTEPRKHAKPTKADEPNYDLDASLGEKKNVPLVLTDGQASALFELY